MLLTKDDLAGIYQWPSGPAPSAFSGNPTRRLFNRHNGEQVLFIINQLAQESDRFSIEDAHRLEKAISNLPLEAKSEITILNTLRDRAYSTSPTSFL